MTVQYKLKYTFRIIQRRAKTYLIWIFFFLFFLRIMSRKFKGKFEKGKTTEIFSLFDSFRISITHNCS